MSNIKAKVMTIANRLHAKGMSRSLATVKAWAIAKTAAFRSKVAGVTFGSRQNALQQLSEVKENIAITLKREPHNSHDSNAIAVYAATNNNQVFFIGYLKRVLALVLAPLMDKGINPQVKGFAIVGGFAEYVSYGMSLSISI